MRNISDILDCWQDLSLCELAQAYAKAGLYVFPLAPREKRPMAGSRGFKDATVNPEQIEAWWSQYPDMNIGIATGTVSGILVVDVDAQHGGLATMESIRDLLPATLTATTGSGGKHIIYMAPKGLLVKSGAGLWQGIDVRCEGGYIVAPGSFHPNGTQYAWDQGVSKIMPAGLALTTALVDKQSGQRKFTQTISKKIKGSFDINDIPYIAKGGRNDKFASIAGVLLKKNFSEAAAVAICLEINRTRTEQDSDWTEKEVTNTVVGIFRRYGE